MADSAVSVVPGALTNAQSAVNAAATRAVGQAENATSALTNLTEQIANRIALNCSIGTKKVCVNYRSGKECFTLPFNTSLLVPKPLTQGSNPVTSGIQDAVGLAVERLTPLSDRVGTVLTYFDELLISSSVLLLFLVIGFVFSIQGLQ